MFGFFVSIGFVVAVAWVAEKRGHNAVVWGVIAFLASVISSAAVFAIGIAFSDHESTALLVGMLAPVASITACAAVAYASMRIEPPRPAPPVVATGRVEHAGSYREPAAATNPTGAPAVQFAVAVTDPWLVIALQGQAREQVAYRSITEVRVLGSEVEIVWLDDVGAPRSVRVSAYPPTPRDAKKLASAIEAKRPVE